MKCNLSQITRLLKQMRYLIFPESQLIDKRTEELGRQIEGLRHQKARTTEIIQQVNQPDVLRSLVISMNRNAGGH